MAADLFIPPSKALDANANPFPGAKWFFYATGTTTPQSVYTTSVLNVAHTNPVVADSTGKFANIYFDAALTYRGILKNADESVTLHDIDPINSNVLADLTGTTGAANVGTADGSTVQAFLNSQKIDETAGNLIYGSTNSGALLNGTPAGTKDGDISTAFGIGTLTAATSAYALAAFGYNALNGVTTGHSNTGLGYQAGLSLTTGIMNTLVGVDAMYLSVSGRYNTVLGHHCVNVGVFNGDGLVAIGQQTARNFTSGDNMIWIGRNAGANSPATGSVSCEVIGAGAAIAASVANSTIIGKDAVAIAGAISNSVFIGKFAQYGGGTVASNAVVGVEAFFRATGGGGDNNTALGFQSGYSIAGTGNVFIGYRAGWRSSDTTVNSAVCIGNLAGFGASGATVASGDLWIANSGTLASTLIWGNFGTQVLNLRSNALSFKDLPTHADNAAAVTAGLAVERVYKTATGELRIVV